MMVLIFNYYSSYTIMIKTKNSYRSVKYQIKDQYSLDGKYAKAIYFVT